MCCAVDSITLYQDNLSQPDRMALVQRNLELATHTPPAAMTRIYCLNDTRMDHSKLLIAVKEPDKVAKSPVTLTVSDSEEKYVRDKAKMKKKWKTLPLSDTGFNLSLFPRPTKPAMMGDEEKAIFFKIEADLMETETLLERCRLSTSLCLEGKMETNLKYIRCDRDRKKRKASKQVKNKYCVSVKNNMGRKKLFIHHRIYKRIELEVRLYTYLPCPREVKSSVIKDNEINKTRLRDKVSHAGNSVHGQQSLAYAIDVNNRAADIPADLVSVLIGMQHRELTPEDYETLLLLDESVAPKTISKTTLSQFRTDTVKEELIVDLCVVCMEAYRIGQERKFLPCGHVFHCSCIDMWLQNSSLNCPVDGLPVVDTYGATTEPQNLAYALDINNRAEDIPADSVSVFISMHHREITPEDYETLLHLDESVAPSTISETTLSKFRTDTVTEDSTEDLCTVCMIAYTVGQERKFLPCNHVFHSSCIDMWLLNSSQNCPIDGLPVTDA
ncbi:hypothetical protein ACJMK2_040382 [Sinanodonta woodiana]|uniref:RING-type domain-containing protein n=1 Tax=Sinanodonta woodiana TaxID=1069815 RepID=A0ABD3WGF7_SINWO